MFLSRIIVISPTSPSSTEGKGKMPSKVQKEGRGGRRRETEAVGHPLYYRAG